MAKNCFKRYLWLIDLIDRRGYITFREIDAEWRRSPLNEDRPSPLPERSFHNHLAAIRDIFGIEILNDRTWGYYIKDRDGMDEGGRTAWLLRSVSVSNTIRECADMRDRILLEEVPSADRHLASIIGAMRDSKVISMTYKSYGRSEPVTFRAEPWCVKQFRQRWYLLAKSEGHDSPRIYCLDDRFICMEEMDESFALPEGFSAEEFFRDRFGIIIGDGKPCCVKIRVDEDQVQYYRSLPLHHSQKEIETTDSYSVFSYRLATTFDFWQEILSKGDTVEVLEPQDFRDWIAGTARSMAELYER